MGFIYIIFFNPFKNLFDEGLVTLENQDDNLPSLFIKYLINSYTYEEGVRK